MRFIKIALKTPEAGFKFCKSAFQLHLIRSGFLHFVFPLRANLISLPQSPRHALTKIKRGKARAAFYTPPTAMS